MPLASSTLVPWQRKASASWPPRPNINGSPPLMRTKRSPARISLTLGRRTRVSGVLWQPPRLATRIARGGRRRLRNASNAR
jgi:hypothetical protein